MQFKERDEVDPFFYDPEAEDEYLAEKYQEHQDRLCDECKDEMIERSIRKVNDECK